ncbi:MAG: RagB/SusD family nutrient uptake outer membrane protein [Bacteroidales bacterium]|nr:RagB/SusD family nutrient uptake outer membrane protein [Bacteroidales bacterium]
MKYQKYILGTLSAACMGMVMPACSDDFIDEELNHKQSTAYFQTQEGLDDLITGTYSALKFKFNYSTWSYVMWPMGTDEFSDGNNQDAAWNGYMLNATDSKIANLWDNMFNRIESANVAIKNIPLYYSQSSSTYNTRLGEAYFLRAFCYFQLVQQYGGVPLQLEPSEGVIKYDYVRATAKECFAQIISDFEQAYSLLPTEIEATGRISKYAAAHFIAKAKLFRQSELNASWSAEYKDADLKDVIAKSDEVIAAHPLCADYVELWDYKQANGANETVSEVVLAAQFSDDQSTWGRFGNQMHLAYPSVYQDMAGTKRDISGDREFCYLRTTNYALDVFDRVNDSRFWKTFITTYGCNSTANAPTYTTTQDYLGVLPSVQYVTTDTAGVVLSTSGPTDAVVTCTITPNKELYKKGTIQMDSTYSKRFVGSELGIKYIINDAGDTEYANIGVEGQVTRNGVMQAPHTFVRYFKGEEEGWTSVHGNYSYHSSATQKRFVAVSKFRDGYRINISNQFGTRDGIIARSAEDVLFAAEAYARKGDYTNCVKYLNMLRDRAAYKAGEDRAKHVDGGQAYKNNTYCAGKGGGYSADGAIYFETNTYFESNKLEGQETTINSQASDLHLNDVNDILNSARDNKIYNALTDKSNFGSDETFSKVMNFILNERTRELCGEMQRWIDLSRCKALKGRWEAFNDGCGREGKDAFEDYMNLRPIPQTAYIDAITTPDAASQQNPGY